LNYTRDMAVSGLYRFHTACVSKQPDVRGFIPGC